MLFWFDEARKTGVKTMKSKSIKIIVNIDDTGNHPETINAAIDLWQKKRISSISLMAYGPDFENTAKKLKSHKIPTGIHLGANHGSPVLPAVKVPSLCDADGKFHDQLGRTLKYYKLPDVEKELCAQIEKVLDAGLTPTHLDSHMGLVYLRRDLQQLFVKLIKKYKLSAALPGFFLFSKMRKTVRQSGIAANDTFQVRYSLPKRKHPPIQARRLQYEKIFKRLTPGLHYFASHPIVPTEEVKNLFDDIAVRDADYQFFQSDEWPALLKKYGIELTYF